MHHVVHEIDKGRTGEMGNAIKWLVSWDFHGKPRRTFFKIWRQEFGETPDVRRVLANTYLCSDDYTARRVRALVLFYGADCQAFAVNGANLESDRQACQDAEQFIDRLHQTRLQKRGWPKGRPRGKRKRV